MPPISLDRPFHSLPASSAPSWVPPSLPLTPVASRSLTTFDPSLGPQYIQGTRCLQVSAVLGLDLADIAINSDNSSHSSILKETWWKHVLEAWLSLNPQVRNDLLDLRRREDRSARNRARNMNDIEFLGARDIFLLDLRKRFPRRPSLLTFIPPPGPDIPSWSSSPLFSSYRRVMDLADKVSHDRQERNREHRRSVEWSMGSLLGRDGNAIKMRKGDEELIDAFDILASCWIQGVGGDGDEETGMLIKAWRRIPACLRSQGEVFRGKGKMRFFLTQEQL
ncbi:hypothetical protein BJ684DRAFT_20953 [Piptocephalis cylindrospora]|uniref:Uncharacterized protein n=1 Tax=Piptocephalis cylindrospora TaxID=1907219 RepID=A0A4P9Y173_9FUNG|nr:hypothetical protein BJ684DRAFT_20953 [Piptocephalis cylindrospora]|eukprot:RKP12518.1 hypothetical protein BJ684DRAFT_20953 [Piptocephalis cylindrospora]